MCDEDMAALVVDNGSGMVKVRPKISNYPSVYLSIFLTVANDKINQLFSTLFTYCLAMAFKHRPNFVSFNIFFLFLQNNLALDIDFSSLKIRLTNLPYFFYSLFGLL